MEQLRNILIIGGYLKLFKRNVNG